MKKALALVLALLISEPAQAGLFIPPATDFTGTWTPTLAGDGTAGSPTYSVQLGQVVNTLHSWTAYFTVGITAVGGMTGNLTIPNVPFQQPNPPNANLCAVVVSFMQGITLTTNYTVLTGNAVRGTSTVLFTQHGSGQTSVSLPISGVAATSQIGGSITCFK